MEQQRKDARVLLLILGFIIAAIAVTVAYGLGASLAFKDGYERGQLDALTGTIQYQLETRSDSTRVWVEVKSFKLPERP